MPKIINHDDFIGNVYEDKFGNLWKVLKIYKKDKSGQMRTMCLCINEINGDKKEVRFENVKSYKGKERNTYEFKNDYVIGYTTNKNDMFLIDHEDYYIVKDFLWYTDSEGYVCTNRKGKRLSLHRLVMKIDDRNVFVDHENHNKLDNRKSKLRLTDNQHNSMNKSVSRSNTGFIGIYKVGDKFNAKIKHNFKSVYLGTYENIDDAIVSRLKAELEYFKEFAPQRHLFKEYGIGVD